MFVTFYGDMPPSPPGKQGFSETPRCSTLLLSGDERINKHKQLLRIVPGMGGGQICLCVVGEKGNT